MHADKLLIIHPLIKFYEYNNIEKKARHEMATDICLNRLKKEYKSLLEKPIESIRAAPKPSNMLEWHYVLEGCKGSPYEQGYYHGILTFPQEYPLKPPSIQMITPSGRFETNTKLCLSMSDFHPESWSPIWNVGTILNGLSSFMVDTATTVGSITTSSECKRSLALTSLEFNSKNEDFAVLFPDLVDLYHQKLRAAHLKLEADLANKSSASTANNNSSNSDENYCWLSNTATLHGGNSKNEIGNGGGSGVSHLALVAVLGAIFASLYVIFSSVS